MHRNAVLLSKTIVAQHFKLLTGLRHLLSYATSSFSPSASTHLVIVTVVPDEVAAITVKLFDQTLLADMEMLYMKETVFCVQDGAPLMDCTHQHWPPHCTGRCIRTGRSIQAATAPVCSPACDMFIKTQATPLWSAWR